MVCLNTVSRVFVNDFGCLVFNVFAAVVDLTCAVMILQVSIRQTLVLYCGYVVEITCESPSCYLRSTVVCLNTVS